MFRAKAVRIPEDAIEEPPDFEDAADDDGIDRTEGADEEVEGVEVI